MSSSFITHGEETLDADFSGENNIVDQQHDGIADELHVEEDDEQITSAFDISSVPLNVDPNPEVIVKKPSKRIRYKQGIAVKFLKPPTPEQPGDIIIQQEPDVQAAPVPPLLVQQRPTLPDKPAPLVLREKPPQEPAPIPPKLITLAGKILPPPPRRLIVERLPILPPLPRDIIVERWLGYNDRVRRVIYKPAPKLIPAPAPKNTIIQWASPDVQLDREYKYLGGARTNPAQYVSHFAGMLADAKQLPKVVIKHFKAPKGNKLGEKYRPDVPKLIGDVDALKLIDLDAVGLSDYKKYFKHASIEPVLVTETDVTGQHVSKYNYNSEPTNFADFDAPTKTTVFSSYNTTVPSYTSIYGDGFALE